MNSSRLARSSIEVLWELPLALLSFLFYKTIRFGMRQVVRAHAALTKQHAGEWRVLCAQTVQAPLTLPALMTTGPRWNTHAIVAIAGPLVINQSIRLHVASATKSAQSWTVVVHSSPRHQIVTSVGSSSISGRDAWESLDMRPGMYRLALRYYRWSDLVELPAIEVDGIEVVPATIVPANVNDFYHDLGRRSNFFYLCLHYYVATLLRYYAWLPRSFVEREYLPAGNPETDFYYGFLKTGEWLAFDLAPRLLQTHDVYLTVYNRASFPVLWCPIREHEHTTRPSPSDGSYLVRVHKKSPSQEPFDRGWLRVRVLCQHGAKREDQTVGIKSEDATSPSKSSQSGHQI